MAGLLFLLAHPDDETFIAGGMTAKYAAAGVEIGVVRATRGERACQSRSIFLNCSVPGSISIIGASS